MKFEESRTAEIIEAEMARGGPAPASAAILLFTGMIEAGAPLPFAKAMFPTIAKAVIMATGEKDETFKAICAAIKTLGADLQDIAGELK